MIINKAENILIAGIDDATKCPCIGSIFLAGVVADAQTIEEWGKLGVKDSKLVAPQKREWLAKHIKKTAAAFTIKEITPAMMDDKSVFNLNDWEMAVVLSIVKYLHKKTAFEKVYIDNWETSSKGFNARLTRILSMAMKPHLRAHKLVLTRKKLISINYIPEHKADENYTVVGAASILAKVASDAQYRKYKKQFGDFGSGNPGDPKTRLFVWLHREDPLPIIRTSWQTYKTLAPLAAIEDDPLRLKKADIKALDIQ